MIRAPNVIVGPPLYRHACRQCAEETLHNARGCVRCGTLPWTTPIEFSRYTRRILEAPARKKRVRW